MSTIESDAVTAATGTNTDLSLSGKGTGVPDLAAGFKVGSVAGVPTASIRDDAITGAKIADDAVTLAKMAAGTDGNIISFDASGNPVAIATGNDGQVLTSAGAGAQPAFEDAASGAWTQLADTTVTGSPSLIALDSVLTGYHAYKIIVIDIKRASGSGVVEALFTVGGTATTSGYDWRVQGGAVGSASLTDYTWYASDTTEIKLLEGTTPMQYSGEFFIHSGVADTDQWFVNGFSNHNAGGHHWFIKAAYDASDKAHNGIDIFFQDSAAITHGRVIALGIGAV